MKSFEKIESMVKEICNDLFGDFNLGGYESYNFIGDELSEIPNLEWNDNTEMTVTTWNVIDGLGESNFIHVVTVPQTDDIKAVVMNTESNPEFKVIDFQKYLK